MLEPIGRSELFKLSLYLKETSLFAILTSFCEAQPWFPTFYLRTKKDKFSKKLTFNVTFILY